jgi:hypothetical protein
MDFCPNLVKSFLCSLQQIDHLILMMQSLGSLATQPLGEEGILLWFSATRTSASAQTTPAVADVSRAAPDSVSTALPPATWMSTMRPVRWPARL